MNRVMSVEHPDCNATVDFLDVCGKGGFTVTISRRQDGGVSICVRQAGPRGSSMFRDTDVEIDSFDTGEEPEIDAEDE